MSKKTLGHLNSITIFRSSIFNTDNKMVVEKNKISYCPKTLGHWASQLYYHLEVFYIQYYIDHYGI